MLQIQNTLISLDLFEKHFACDLQQCRGACCVKGDAGAPLTDEETVKIEAIFLRVKPFLRKEGLKTIEKHGKFTLDEEGENVTTLIKGKECAYAVFENDGTAKCAFELAYKAGKTDFIKPVSCHLYPVRIARYNEFEAINFHSWEICRPACECGNDLKIKVFRFVKDALVRRFGEKWFEELTLADKMLMESKVKQATPSR